MDTGKKGSEGSQASEVSHMGFKNATIHCPLSLAFGPPQRGYASDRLSILAALYELCAVPPLLTPNSSFLTAFSGYWILATGYYIV